MHMLLHVDGDLTIPRLSLAGLARKSFPLGRRDLKDFYKHIYITTNTTVVGGRETFQVMQISIYYQSLSYAPQGE